MRLLTWILSLGLLAAIPKAEGALVCRYVFEACESRPAYKTISGGPYPAFADMFNINPASIPVVDTPLGVEGIASTSGNRYAKEDINFALIKGFQRFGTAASSNSDNTFYSYNLVHAYQGTPYRDDIERAAAEGSVLPTINLGASFALIGGKPGGNFLTSIGANARFNRLTNKWDRGLGISFATKYVSAGMSSISSGASANVRAPATRTFFLTIGARYSIFSLELTTINYDAKKLASETKPAFQHNAGILTFAMDLNPIFLTLAHRSATNVDGKRVFLQLIAVQLLATARFSVGYMHNYVPGAHSLGAQFFF